MRNLDALDVRPLSLSAVPDTFLDFAGFTTPSILEQLIEEEDNDMNDINTIDADINDLETLDLDAAEQLISEVGTLDDTDDDKPCMRLDGRLFSIDIYDDMMAVDEFGMASFIKAIANNAQYTLVSNELTIDDMMAKAKEKRDPMSNAKNRIKVESDGDTIDEEVDYELDGLSAAQSVFMAKLEDQNDRARILIADLGLWYSKFSDGKYPMLPQTNEQRKADLVKRRMDKDAAAAQLALKELRELAGKARATRSTRVARVSV